ncbi:MAG: hypothetical protein AAFQ29_13555 [Pseudomonadota bacterium]
MDQMRILCEGADAEAGTALAARIKDSIGVSVTVTVGAPGTVPRSQGKAVRIIDRRAVADEFE